MELEIKHESAPESFDTKFKDFGEILKKLKIFQLSMFIAL